MSRWSRTTGCDQPLAVFDLVTGVSSTPDFRCSSQERLCSEGPTVMRRKVALAPAWSQSGRLSVGFVVVIVLRRAANRQFLHYNGVV